MHRTIKTLLEDGKEITTPSEISLTLKKFYENLFRKNIANSAISQNIEMFLSDIHLPTISDDNYNICEAEITEDNLPVALKSIPNNKTPGNDGLSKDFHETFWEDVKDVFINSLKQAKIEASVYHISLLTINRKIIFRPLLQTCFTFYYPFKSNCVCGK